MTTIKDRFAQCLARGQAIDIHIRHLPKSGHFVCTRDNFSGADQMAKFTGLDKLEAWLASAEGLMVSALTDQHQAEAKACGWTLATYEQTDGFRHSYVLAHRPANGKRLVVCTYSFDVIETKLAQLKANGWDLL